MSGCGSLGLGTNCTSQAHVPGAVAAIQSAVIVAQRSHSRGSAVRWTRSRLSRSCSGQQEREFYVELVESKVECGSQQPYKSIGGPGGSPTWGSVVMGTRSRSRSPPVGGRPRGGGEVRKCVLQFSTPARPVAPPEVWPLLDRLYRVDTNLKLRQRSKGWRSGGGGSATRSHHMSVPRPRPRSGPRANKVLHIIPNML